MVQNSTQDSFDYSKLRGRIKERIGNQRNFASLLNVSHVTLSAKLNNKVGWSQKEMIAACIILDNGTHNILEYFFTKKV